uniref:Putative aluminum-activated malate transporter 14 n=1 Tax=Davidia involucrata TaxID=16924 RepID=A0A5B7ANT1_DAVIN
MGFSVCIFTSLFIFPMWASDELHYSVASKFENLACCIEGCLEEYFRIIEEKENQPVANFNSCKSVLHSKSNEESMANFARWEPWHGKFGLSYPWDKYLQIGEVLRELAATILSLKGCLRSPRQPSSSLRQSIKEPCEMVGSSLAWTLKELGESTKNMKRCRPKASIAPKLQSMKLELSLVTSPSKLGRQGNGEGLAISSFVFS